MTKSAPARATRRAVQASASSRRGIFENAGVGRLFPLVAIRRRGGGSSAQGSTDDEGGSLRRRQFQLLPYVPARRSWGFLPNFLTNSRSEMPRLSADSPAGRRAGLRPQLSRARGRRRRRCLGAMWWTDGTVMEEGAGRARRTCGCVVGDIGGPSIRATKRRSTVQRRAHTTIRSSPRVYC